MKQKSIVLNYKVRKDYCNCCEQKLPKPKTSEVREFEFNKHDLTNWADWKDIVEFEDGLEEMVREYVYETISFFATSSTDRVIIENSEMEKMKQFILCEVVT